MGVKFPHKSEFPEIPTADSPKPTKPTETDTLHRRIIVGNVVERFNPKKLLRKKGLPTVDNLFADALQTLQLELARILQIASSPLGLSDQQHKQFLGYLRELPRLQRAELLAKAQLAGMTEEQLAKLESELDKQVGTDSEDSS
jgi:hypothetical protein